MLINELAKAVHENAVAHGWWDDEREAPEIIALIHSEWSEALEEARAGRPLVWYRPDPDFKCCATSKCGAYIDGVICHGPSGLCFPPCPMQRKPEGIAVELIDGCIRILDYMGRLKSEITENDGCASEIESLYSDANVEKIPDKVPEVIAYLHLNTSGALANGLTFVNVFALLHAMALALSWVKKQGLDPLAILLEKHEYNKCRPYKHGKKF